MSASMEDALADALLWLDGESPENRLTETMFGRYSDGTGYWWTLRFSLDVKNGEAEDPRQDKIQRTRLVIGQWARDKARVDEQEAGS